MIPFYKKTKNLYIHVYIHIYALKKVCKSIYQIINSHY